MSKFAEYLEQTSTNKKNVTIKVSWFPTMEIKTEESLRDFLNENGYKELKIESFGSKNRDGSIQLKLSGQPRILQTWINEFYKTGNKKDDRVENYMEVISGSDKRKDYKELKEKLNDVMNILSKYKGKDKDLDNDISKLNSQAFSVISYTKFWNSED